MNIGPMFADPVARQLYAEIASIEEQHVTQYESIIDPDETLAREVAAARGDARSTTTTAACSRRRTRASRRSGSASSTTSSAPARRRASCSRSTSGAIRRRSLPRRCPSRSRSRASASSCARRLHSEVDLRADGTEIVEPRGRAAELARLSRADELGGLALGDRRRGYSWRPGTEVLRKVANL